MLAANILVARILAREFYGELGIIRSTINMFTVFAGFGMGVTATKHVSEFRERDPERAGRIMVLSSFFTITMGSAITGVLIISAPWLATHSLHAPHLTTELQIGSIILLISAINGAQTGALAGLEAFKMVAWVNFWVGLSSFPLFVCGAYFGGLRGTVWALAANTGINWFLNHLALRRETRRFSIPFTLKHCFKEWPVLWTFSLPAILSGIMVTPVMWLCSAILVNQPDGFGQMGVFDAANQWRAAILFIPAMIGQIALPMLSSLSGADNREKYIQVLKINLLLNGSAALVLALLVSLAAPWIMRSYGPGFASGDWILICLSVTTVLASVNGVIGQAIASKSQMWIGLLFNFMWAVALLGFGYALMHRGYGARGLAAANLIAYVLHTVWQAVYLVRLLKQPINGVNLGPAIISGQPE
jgi:O-antigen/teichoic acid export membrane protein